MIIVKGENDVSICIKCGNHFSIRSKTGTSANRCARQYFNGGGHENAAGGRLNVPEDVSDVNNVAEYIEKHKSNDNLSLEEAYFFQAACAYEMML